MVQQPQEHTMNYSEKFVILLIVALAILAFVEWACN